MNTKWKSCYDEFPENEITVIVYGIDATDRDYIFTAYRCKDKMSGETRWHEVFSGESVDRKGITITMWSPIDTLQFETDTEDCGNWITTITASKDGSPVTRQTCSICKSIINTNKMLERCPICLSKMKI